MEDFISSLDVKIDPIGESKPEVNGVVDNLKKKWDELKNIIKGNKTLILSAGIKFLVMSLDSLISYVETSFPGLKGADKKATVMLAVNALYDYVISPILPIWLKPIGFGIKAIVINTLCSIIIDWIVSKYNSGAWAK